MKHQKLALALAAALGISAVAQAAPSIEAQLDMMAKSSVIRNGAFHEDGLRQTYFTVTDLDGNGRPEIFSPKPSARDFTRQSKPMKRARTAQR